MTHGGVPCLKPMKNAVNPNQTGLMQRTHGSTEALVEVRGALVKGAKLGMSPWIPNSCIICIQIKLGEILLRLGT